jgi:hypothetical protein
VLKWGNMGMEQMIDRISHNSHVQNGLAVCPPRPGRPLLTGSVRVDRPIPVGVRIRVVRRDVPVEPNVVPVFKPASIPQPVGTLLDCYL